jgi:hypothetical protein
MLSVYDLAFYKEMYKGHKIIYVLFNNKEYVFKSLGRKEYQHIIDLTSNEYELEDAICQTALVYPEEYDFAYSPHAGISNNIAPLIVEISGFSKLDSVLDMYQQSKIKVERFDEQCIALVKAAFPEYRHDEMEEWTWEQLMDYSARAEVIMRLLGHDVSLVNKKDEVEEEVKKQADFVKELRKNGIDPMFYFKDEIMQKKDYLEFPLIGGIHWQNEVILNDIRKQMATHKQ